MNHRWVARGLVVGLHLALLAALWLHRTAPLPDGQDRRMTLVRIVTAPPQQVPPLPGEPGVRYPRLPSAPALVPPPPIVIEGAPPDSPATTPAATAQPAATTSPAEPPRTTLRLTLPPGAAASSAAARNPALTDPRSNTARRTVEDRIADALGGSSGEWTEERTSDHRTLLRRGDTCVEVLRSRIADMDRFNENVAPRAMSMVGKPYKCK